MVLNPVAWAHEALGAHLAAQGSREEAAESYRKALAVWGAWKHPGTGGSVEQRRREEEAAAAVEPLPEGVGGRACSVDSRAIRPA